jgi:hypothetical protein
MPIKQRWTIPSDMDQDTEWVHVGMCIPNTRMWRGVVAGCIYNLSRGRHWDENTGTITDAQSVGREIFKSMTIDCNNNWERIADALEAINLKTPELYTLAELLTSMEGSSLGDIADLVSILEWAGFSLPNIDIKLPASDILSMWFGMRRWRAVSAGILAHTTTMKSIASTLAASTGVEVVDEITVDIWALIDQLITTGGSIGSLLAGIAAIGSLFRGEYPGHENDEPDVDPGLRSLVNVLLEQGAAMQTQTNIQTVNCGGGGVCFDGTGGFIADEAIPDTSIDDTGYTQGTVYQEPPPAGWDEWEGEDGYLAYKCQAANAMLLGLAERLYQIGSLQANDFQKDTHALTQNAIAVTLRALDSSIIAASESGVPVPLFTSDVDNPVLVACRSWTAQKLADLFYPVDTEKSDLNIFYDLRLDFISDREAIVCDLYQASTTGAARAAITDAMDTYLATYGYPTATKTWAAGIFSDMLVNKWLNLLFTPNTRIAQYEDSTATDCLQCGVGEVLDTFTDDNDTNLLDHEPDEHPEGILWGMIRVGTWTITSNKAHSTATENARIAIETGLSDCTVSCDIVPQDAENYRPGILFRVSNSNNYWLFCAVRTTPGNLFYRLYKRVAGTGYIVAEVATTAVYTEREFKVTLLGDAINCYIDDGLVFSEEDTFNETASGHGMHAGLASNATFDNFEVT